MNKQRKVLITITYNEMGIIIDSKAEEVAQPDLQPTCNQLATESAIESLPPVEPPKTDQPVCEDAISKHDLWRIIEDNAYWITYNETSKEKGMTLTGINQALNESPPVTPTERTGEWIVHPLMDEGRAELECPICGDTFVRAIDYRPHFCEHCGSKMGGDTE